MSWNSISEFFSSEYTYISKIEEVATILSNAAEYRKTHNGSYYQYDNIYFNPFWLENEQGKTILEDEELGLKELFAGIQNINKEYEHLPLQKQKEKGKEIRERISIFVQEFFNNDEEKAVSTIQRIIDIRTNSSKRIEEYTSLMSIATKVQAGASPNGFFHEALEGKDVGIIKNSYILPSQHYPRYPLLLESFLKKLSDDLEKNRRKPSQSTERLQKNISESSQQVQEFINTANKRSNLIQTQLEYYINAIPVKERHYGLESVALARSIREVNNYFLIKNKGLYKYINDFIDELSRNKEGKELAKYLTNFMQETNPNIGVLIEICNMHLETLNNEKPLFKTIMQFKKSLEDYQSLIKTRAGTLYDIAQYIEVNENSKDYQKKYKAFHTMLQKFQAIYGNQNLLPSQRDKQIEGFLQTMRKEFSSFGGPKRFYNLILDLEEEFKKDRSSAFEKKFNFFQKHVYQNTDIAAAVEISKSTATLKVDQRLHEGKEKEKEKEEPDNIEIFKGPIPKKGKKMDFVIQNMHKALPDLHAINDYHKQLMDKVMLEIQDIILSDKPFDSWNRFKISDWKNSKNYLEQHDQMRQALINNYLAIDENDPKQADLKMAMQFISKELVDMDLDAINELKNYLLDLDPETDRLQDIKRHLEDQGVSPKELKLNLIQINQALQFQKGVSESIYSQQHKKLDALAVKLFGKRLSQLKTNLKEIREKEADLNDFIELKPSQGMTLEDVQGLLKSLKLQLGLVRHSGFFKKSASGSFSKINPKLEAIDQFETMLGNLITNHGAGTTLASKLDEILTGLEILSNIKDTKLGTLFFNPGKQEESILNFATVILTPFLNQNKTYTQITDIIADARLHIQKNPRLS